MPKDHTDDRIVGNSDSVDKFRAQEALNVHKILMKELREKVQEIRELIED